MTDSAQETAAELERARTAYSERSWLDAYDGFARADREAPLEAEDLELFATTARMRGLDDDVPGLLERAHRGYLEQGDVPRAAFCAIWIGISLAYHGAVGPAAGWLGRAERLLADSPEEVPAHGYLLLPRMFQLRAAGDLEGAAAVAGKAAEMGRRLGDDDLFALALHGQGDMLISAGRVADGLALLDESMITVTTGELSPFVAGIVYCGVILACQAVFEVGRAREWTLALTEWAEAQPELLAFTGRCRIHRSEILQLDGSWQDALEEARLARERVLKSDATNAGLACYREAELHRLAGTFDVAEELYREASRLGWEPQPGLAQLRLAQHRLEAALAAIRRACAEVSEPLKRAALLPAYVEIALATSEIEEARTACLELRDLAGRFESAMLQAMLGHARGALLLADGDARGALAELRAAGQIWRELNAPYEIARTRVLVSLACAALGDDEAAALELEAAREVFEELGAKPDLERLVPAPTHARHGLSARELEVLRLVAAGKSNREIAAALVISEHTVARHLQNIYAKLGLPSRAAATAFAFEHELV